MVLSVSTLSLDRYPMLWPAWLGLLVVSWLNVNVFRVSPKIQIDGWYFLVFRVGFQDGKGNSVPSGPRHPCNPNPDENSRLQFYSLKLFLGYFQANEASMRINS